MWKNKTTKDSNGLQSRVMGSGIPLSEKRYPSMNSLEQTMDLQDGGHYYELAKHQPRMYEEDKRHQPISIPVDGLYTPEQIEKFGDDDMRRKKCHILDCLLDTFPDHLKAKAKSMCDTLKCKDRLFIFPSHEILIDGEVVRGSNIRDYIMDSLNEPPTPGTLKFKMLEKENERLKRNVAYYEKALARARDVSRCRKFESMTDGTVECCYFSDDTNNDESDMDDDTDENEDNDEYDDTDGTEEDEDVDDEEEDDDDIDDDDEYSDDDEPSKKRKKKN